MSDSVLSSWTDKDGGKNYHTVFRVRYDGLLTKGEWEHDAGILFSSRKKAQLYLSKLVASHARNPQVWSCVVRYIIDELPIDIGEDEQWGDEGAAWDEGMR